MASVGSTTRRPVIGDRVVLSPDYATKDDAAGGPLRPGDVGEVVTDDGSSKPFRVKAADGGFDLLAAIRLRGAPSSLCVSMSCGVCYAAGRTWWYVADAVQLLGQASFSPAPAGLVRIALHPHDLAVRRL